MTLNKRKRARPQTGIRNGEYIRLNMISSAPGMRLPGFQESQDGIPGTCVLLEYNSGIREAVTL